MIDDRRLLRDAFGAFMTGVTVITTRNADDIPMGFTANSFSSVSLDPPLLLVSVARSSRNYDAYQGAGAFAVNVLSEDQREVSNTFARPSEDRFAAVAWREGPLRSPILDDASAWFDCHMHQVVDAGDHAILIGRIAGFESSGAPGLGYYRGSYFTPARTAAAVAVGPAVTVGAILEHAGQVLLIDDRQGGLALPWARADREGVGVTLTKLIAATGIMAEPGVLYSVYEDVEHGLQHLVFLCTATGGEPVVGAGFVELSHASFTDVADPATRIMLERLVEESRVGNYGVYHGDHTRGRVLQIAKEHRS